MQQTEQMFCVNEILLSLMYNRMVLIVIQWRYRMPFCGNGRISTLVNATSWAKIINERHKSVNECRFNNMDALLR